MSTNIIKDATSKVKSSGMVLPVVLVFIAMFLVSCALMYEDYTTSKLGYMSLPTQKANPWVIPLVALLPQLGQVGFGYVFMTDTNKRWSVLVAILLWVVDVFTDVYYKSHGLDIFWKFGATVETIAIYTVGSELMMVTSVAMLVDLLPAFFRQLGVMFKGIIVGDGNRGRTAQVSGRPVPGHPQGRPMQQGPLGMEDPRVYRPPQPPGGKNRSGG